MAKGSVRSLPPSEEFNHFSRAAEAERSHAERSGAEAAGCGDFGIAMRLPDLRFINRKIPIIDVARVLDLRLGDNGNIHCWRPELHQNGDRTASIGIRKRNNTVKCFGCGIGPLGAIDLVIAVLGLKTAGEAARWIAERFPVPELPRGKHLVQPERRIFQVGFESELGILIRSGLWAAM